MQPAIHQEKNPDIYRFGVRLFVAMYCGLHFLFIIPRESPCISRMSFFQKIHNFTRERVIWAVVMARMSAQFFRKQKMLEISAKS
jgi:hypothetical protein